LPGYYWYYLDTKATSISKSLYDMLASLVIY
jgi:hypothetical protein